ncbi:MAG TPA: DUF1570 domain-containing protein [Planctomycetota bacterium]|mgnify:CR=1 FL=1|nr:DUF1570 domain-containing protein [Planctomycetota bacterium]
MVLSVATRNRTPFRTLTRSIGMFPSPRLESARLRALTLSAIAFVSLALALTPQLSGQEGIKKGPWKARHAPPGWLIHSTSNYQIQSQVEVEKAKRLADHMEGMLKVYKKYFPPGKPSSGKAYAVKLFKNREAFIDYSGAAGAAGYYSSTDREMVLYDTGRWMDEPQTVATGGDGEIDFEALKQRMQMDILGVASHEGWHQYFHWYVVSWIDLPSWVNEGMGDYFYTATPKVVGGKKIPAVLGRLNQERLPTIQAAVRANKHVPIEKILQYTQREYYSNPGVCYAEGWALCHFLLHSENKSYNDLVPRFVKRFRNDGNREKITAYIFKGVDFAKLEEEFKAWVLAQKADDPVGDAVKAANEAMIKKAEKEAAAAGSGQGKPGGEGKPNGEGKPDGEAKPEGEGKKSA